MANKVNPIQMQKFLKGIDYPVSKDELLKTAEDEGADENVMETLRQIPMDEFNSPNDVAEGIGKIGTGGKGKGGTDKGSKGKGGKEESDMDDDDDMEDEL